MKNKTKKIWIACLALVALGVWLVVMFDSNASDSRHDPKTAIGDTSDLPRALKRALIPSSFRVLGPPGQHDWLANHPEPGQTFDQFAASKFNRPGKERNVIYLQPIGGFPSDESPRLTDLEELAGAYFTLPVRLLEPLRLEGAPLKTRTNPRTHKRQVLAPDVLEWLKGHLPSDAYCLLGITMEDLYPKPSWNFVFGLASISERVGVFSFARYDPAFYGDQRRADYATLLLSRCCKIVAHEIGHMFGLYHCIHYECGMNGSNHLAESDLRPIHLCPVCLRKLLHATGSDVVERYRALQAIYRRVGLSAQADWVQRRLEAITQAP